MTEKQLIGLLNRSLNTLDKLTKMSHETLADQNDINESTRAQLDAISEALAELQAKGPHQKPMRRIGFIQDDNNK